ncbi:diaminopropionate ammonia-lyase [Colletotrichum tamarilloi]|uniref:Diaminopropionate ammonia-lyase n=1 Tax=Colletotrichum tamarilloi TaxID=1209934 RepID=A0ABQ9R1Z9_9PEZI|nr:diaminopropionate ammonia-lyase [Colletotrichum tamarilloi]KAK1492471.1 diaminopropionate ammonia-lyase [Colletotrichum tamarilloi]
MTTTRRNVYINDSTGPIKPVSDASLAQAFHQQLPAFARTPLVSLEDIAQELGVKAVYIKDESNRLGLPSFKILGASWGTYRAITTHLQLSIDTPLADVAKAAQTNNLSLYAATEGNHGRAVAAMAKILGIPAHIYVPSSVAGEAVTNIASEGAKVIVSNSHYDDAVLEAWQASKSVKGGLLIQDNAFVGYEQIPAWIVEGYSTLVREAEQQVADHGLKPTLMVTPVGVGSLAHAVVSHCKSDGRDCAVLSVEPDTAPCLWTSLTAGKPVTVHTSRTIMEGLNCGTVSLTAFDDLRAGIDASATVSDFEAHEAVKYLQTKGVDSGPCGGATVAALRRLAGVSPRPTCLSKDAVVVLLNTEGPRNYKIPLDVSTDDPVTLTQILTSIDSSNPDLSKASGAGECEIAHYISAWLQHRNFEAHWLEERQGRPSVVGVLRGTGGGKSIMLNGHVDTVSLSSYSPDLDPLSGELKEEDGGRIYGRGSADMKAGLAAAMASMARCSSTSHSPLRGDVILAAVADEENFSIGTEEVIRAGWRADAAIIPEPTNQEMAIAHKGFIWVEIDILGVAAHGSRPEDGVDAILLAGAVQTALLEYSKSLPSDSRLGKASLHAGLIQGGEEPSSYPERCTLTVEFRTIPAQTTERILEDIESILSSIAKSNPDFKYAAPRKTFSRPPLGQSPDDEFIKTFVSATSKCLGEAQEPVACSFWCDAALLNEVGISSVVYGPKSFGIHGKEEWVSVESIREVASVMETVIQEFCA